MMTKCNIIRLLDPGPRKNVFYVKKYSRTIGKFKNCRLDNSTNDRCQFSDFENYTMAMYKGMSFHKEILKYLRVKVPYVYVLLLHGSVTNKYVCIY